MFENLSEKLGSVLDGLRRKGALSEADVDAALKEIRIALLEADVALPSVKAILAQMRERAIGQEVMKSVTPGQQIVKIVHDGLVEMLGGKVDQQEEVSADPINFHGQPPIVIMLAGLQGSGKTTSCAKLARFIKDKYRKKVMMVSLDVARPAAQEQLKILGEQTETMTLPIIAGQPPVEITKRAMQSARLGGFDVIILDTAGRLHIDDALMSEAEQIKAISNPIETLLVADAMTGQDAVQTAREFHQRIGLTGVVLTRMDGDARGGAALSIRSETQCPIKFMGVGEKLDALELFHPERIAQRILGMGDVLSLVEKATETIDQAEAEKIAGKMKKGQFDLEDMLAQLGQLRKMGGIGSLMGMLPGMGKMKQVQKAMGSGDSDKNFVKQEAIIRSMTVKERRAPKIIHASRKRRIAQGSGTSVQEINKLLKQHMTMAKMMKKMGGMDEGKLMQSLDGLMGGGQAPPTGQPPFGMTRR